KNPLFARYSDRSGARNQVRRQIGEAIGQDHPAAELAGKRFGKRRGYPRVSYLREEVAMCRGNRLVADFVAGTGTRPELPGELDEHLTITVNGLWVVWAHKLARQTGNLFVPLTRGPGYPADARAECRARGFRETHDAPDPACTCGFHALSSRKLPGLPVRGDLRALTVALSGRVLALEWAGDGVLWRAERQTVVRIERPAPVHPLGTTPGKRDPRHPGGRPRARPRPPAWRPGAEAADPARRLSGAAGMPRRRRLVRRVQHVRAIAGIFGPDLARAVPAAGATLPPARLPSAHRVGRASPAAAHHGSRSRQDRGQ